MILASPVIRSFETFSGGFEYEKNHSSTLCDCGKCWCRAGCKSILSPSACLSLSLSLFEYPARCKISGYGGYRDLIRIQEERGGGVWVVLQMNSLLGLNSPTMFPRFVFFTSDTLCEILVSIYFRFNFFSSDRSYRIQDVQLAQFPLWSYQGRAVKFPLVWRQKSKTVKCTGNLI